MFNNRYERAMTRELFPLLADMWEARHPRPIHDPIRLLREAMVATCGREAHKLRGEDWKIHDADPNLCPFARQRVAEARVEGARVIWC
jgi:hypothetical protein